MARQKAQRRAYKRRAGLLAAAKNLRCNYSHLRRVVCGERRSRALLNRLRTLKRQQRAASQTTKIPTK